MFYFLAPFTSSIRGNTTKQVIYSVNDFHLPPLDSLFYSHYTYIKKFSTVYINKYKPSYNYTFGAHTHHIYYEVEISHNTSHTAQHPNTTQINNAIQWRPKEITKWILRMPHKYLRYHR